jgi:site-specific recombinase XerD
LRGIAELRSITRAHVIAWRKDLEKRVLAASSIRRKLSALSALFDYLCEHNAVSGNPVDGVRNLTTAGIIRKAKIFARKHDESSNCQARGESLDG